MHTPRRRIRPATGAFFLGLALTVLTAGPGCTLVGKKRAASTAAEGRLVAPSHIEIGRILSYDSADATAVIEFVPQFHGGASLDGTKLISRKLDTLEPTARLVAAPYQNNRTLGAYVESGTPGLDDEVVIAPESALPNP